MKPEQQRIAIAELVGLKDLHYLSGQLCYDSIHSYVVPNCLNDLPAMHEAENIITEDKWDDYDDYLCGVTPYSWNRHKSVIHATASQRAEAFLRTLNKWTDDN